MTEGTKLALWRLMKWVGLVLLILIVGMSGYMWYKGRPISLLWTDPVAIFTGREDEETTTTTTVTSTSSTGSTPTPAPKKSGGASVKLDPIDPAVAKLEAGNKSQKTHLDIITENASKELTERRLVNEAYSKAVQDATLENDRMTLESQQRADYLEEELKVFRRQIKEGEARLKQR